MLDFRRNDLLDDLYNRYLTSFNCTMESQAYTGQKFYDFYVSHLLKCFKKDIKKSDFEITKYFRFQLKKRKLDIKFEKLNFIDLDNDEYLLLSFWGKRKYNRKKRKFLRLNRRVFKLMQKFYLYLPNVETSSEEDISDETDHNVSPFDISNDVSEATVSTETVAEDNVVSEDQTVEKLEALFGDEDCE